MKSGLISEDGEVYSLGRVAFWILLAISAYFWFRQLAFPETLYYFFSYIILYNFSKKPVELVNNYFSNKLTKEVPK